MIPQSVWLTYFALAYSLRGWQAYYRHTQDPRARRRCEELELRLDITGAEFLTYFATVGTEVPGLDMPPALPPADEPAVVEGGAA